MATSKVAVLLGQGFEDSEFRVPVERLREAGFEVDVIATKAGEELRGYKGKEKVKADRGIDDASPEDYAALLIPGGQSPDHLRADPRFVELVRQFDATGRPLAAVCQAVIDGNWITSRQPGDLEAFSQALIDALRAEEEDEEPARRRAARDVSDETQRMDEEAAAEEHQANSRQGPRGKL